MKIVLFLLTFVIAYADISNIIVKIKDMENYKVKCKKIKNFNIFTIKHPKVVNIKSAKNVALKEEIPLVLYAIFQNRANINGKWVKKGDVIDGFYVVKVGADRVILKRNNEIITLKPQINSILKVKQ